MYDLHNSYITAKGERIYKRKENIVVYGYTSTTDAMFKKTEADDTRRKEESESNIERGKQKEK